MEHKPYLDALFGDDIAALMWELSAEKGYFTNYEFIRKIAQRRKGPYIEFLHAMLVVRGEEWPFNLTHQAIGKRLSDEAGDLHYKKIDDNQSGVTDCDIFGNEVKAKVYERTDKVQQP